MVALSMVAMITKATTESILRTMPRIGSLAGLGAGRDEDLSAAVVTSWSDYLEEASSFSLAMRAVVNALCSGPTAVPDLTTLPAESWISHCQLVFWPTPPVRRNLIS